MCMVDVYGAAGRTLMNSSKKNDIMGGCLISRTAADHRGGSRVLLLLNVA